MRRKTQRLIRGHFGTDVPGQAPRKGPGMQAGYNHLRGAPPDCGSISPPATDIWNEGRAVIVRVQKVFAKPGLKASHRSSS